MTIKISKDKIKNFYLLLPFYKCFLFKLFSFQTDSLDEQVNIIINALNIKSRKLRITYIYDKACKIIDNNNYGKNICGFKNCKCYVQRKYKKQQIYGCCRKCVYVTDNGCPSSNLACKLFNCSEVYNRCKVTTYKDLKILKALSLRGRFIVKSDYFSLREDVLKDLYSYSILYSTFRIVYRLFKNLILKK